MNAIPTIPSTFPLQDKINPPRMAAMPSRPSLAKRPIKNLGLAIFTLLLTVALISIGFKVLSQRAPQQSAVKTPSVAGSKIIDLDKTFTFPALNRQGKKLDQPLEYTVVSAERTKQIILKGRKASAVEGRVFLIVNLKLKNQNDTSAMINTREVIRLLPESLAPDIHNDPVEIQPISSKLTRVGFAISESSTNLKLQIGEIAAEKTTIDLNF